MPCDVAWKVHTYLNVPFFLKVCANLPRFWDFEWKPLNVTLCLSSLLADQCQVTVEPFLMWIVLGVNLYPETFTEAPLPSAGALTATRRPAAHSTATRRLM